MAFDTNRLSKIANLRDPGADNATPGLFFYQSDTTIANTKAAGYFNNGRAELGQALPGEAVTAQVVALCTDGFRILTLTLPADNSSDITAVEVLGAVS